MSMYTRADTAEAGKEGRGGRKCRQICRQKSDRKKSWKRKSRKQDMKKVEKNNIEKNSKNKEIDKRTRIEKER